MAGNSKLIVAVGWSTLLVLFPKRRRTEISTRNVELQKIDCAQLDTGKPVNNAEVLKP